MKDALREYFFIFPAMSFYLFLSQQVPGSLGGFQDGQDKKKEKDQALPMSDPEVRLMIWCS